VIVNCGSATATLTRKGKTYKFSRGQCVSEGKSITLDPLEHASGSDRGLSGLAEHQRSAKFPGTKKDRFSGTNTSFGGVSISKKPVPFSGTYNCGGTIYPFLRPHPQPPRVADPARVPSKIRQAPGDPSSYI
jgi:hypothetical protein